MRYHIYRFFLLALVCLLSACGMYIPQAEVKDSGPDQPMNVDHIPDAIPKVELRTAAGNTSPYTVLGKRYTLLDDPNGYSEVGVASWYGRKFQGRKTANGEIYDMYGMTAAHLSLPIPSYVRVTNLSNKKSVIVRVNDRGPFHGNRIIDLTYSAAKKLGYQKQGTAKVLVEYIDPITWQRENQNTPAQQREVSRQPNIGNLNGGEQTAPTPKNSAGFQLPPNTFLQVGAFSQRTGAERLKERLRKLTDTPVLILAPEKGGKPLYRVRIGPFADNYSLNSLRQTLETKENLSPHVVNL